MVKKQQEQEIRFQPIQPQFNVFNRKKLRKEKKQQKKQQHMQINQNRNFKNQGITLPEPQQIEIKPEKKIEKKVEQKVDKPKLPDRKLQQLQKEIEQEDKVIESLSKKLKLKSNRLTKQQLVEDGMEDDLFDFLDHIDATIKEQNPSTYSAYQQKQLNDEQEQIEQEDEMNDDQNDDNEDENEENIDEEEELEEEDEEFEDEVEDELEEEDEEQFGDEDNEDEIEDDNDDDDDDDKYNEDDDIDDDEIEPDQSEEQVQQQVEQNSKKNDTKNEIIERELKKNETSKQPTQHEIEYDEQQLLEVRKLLNRNLNKISEANINNITDEINKIFEQHPKQIVGQAFGQQLILSTIKPIQLLPYLLSCIVTTACYFHQIYDNLFFGELIKCIILKLKSDPEAHEVKNVTLVLCHWYLLESISLQFIKEYIKFLLSQESKKDDNVENLLLIIQYCGKKIRQDNPAILKQIIDDVKESYAETTESRTKFLILTLDDLRLNKKIASQSERLEFLINWHKQRTQKMLHRIFCQGFKYSYDSQFENNNWWKPIVSNEEQTQLYQEFKLQKKNINIEKLEQLAIEQKMVTETRKTAFTVIMGADDLFEATQNLDKLGYLRKKKQDVCLVIVEMCGNEKTYNPYYQELAHYLINFEKGMKQAFQYMLWDKFKLLENYTTRKQMNIGKFCANLLKKESINITLLKWFNFDEITEIQSQFLCIVLQNYLQNLQIEILAKQCKNLFENPDYLPFRTGLQMFLKNRFKDFIDQQQKQNNEMKKDLKIMIRLLNEDVNQ